MDHQDRLGARRHARRATMRDVARQASVSVMTVSRVVNRSGGVDATTRLRVESAIADLGYRQNEAASALRRSDTHTSTVGLVVDDTANPFCAALQRGVERACRERGHLLVSGSSDGCAQEERSLVSAFLRRRVDGLVVMGSDPDQAYLAEEARRGVPTVFVDRAPAGLVADSVVSDNVGAGCAGTAHLLAHGHRRVALLGGRTSIDTTAGRRTGYLAAHEHAGLPVDPALEVLGLADADSAARSLARLLDGADPPTAVVAGQNLLTVGALRTLHERGLQQATALVGIDDVDLAELLEPPVTVVRQHPDRIGRAAAELLFRRLDGADGPAVARVLPVELLVRGSGELPGPARTCAGAAAATAAASVTAAATATAATTTPRTTPTTTATLRTRR